MAPTIAEDGIVSQSSQPAYDEKTPIDTKSPMDEKTRAYSDDEIASNELVEVIDGDVIRESGRWSF